MLYSVFPKFINMSLTASAVILIVALIRPLLRRAPRAVIFLLWAVALFRLVCPVSFSADFSLLQIGSTVDHRIEYIPAELVSDTLQLQNTQPSSIVPHTVSEITSGAAGRTDFARLLLILGTWGWLIGITIFLTIGAVSLIRIRLKCIGAVRISHNTYLADNITVPFVLGILRPRIFLPSNLTEEQCLHIQLHEESHIRRGDPLWKLIAYLTLALHWFNPIVWLGFNLFTRDMEAACDERVLAGMNDFTRADYAETLLSVSSGRHFPGITPAFGEDNPKTRIKTILRYKKPVAIITVISVLLVAAVAVMLLVNPTVKTAPAAEIIPEFPELSGEFYTVAICQNSTDAPLSQSGTLAEEFRMAYTALQTMRVEVKPASESRAEDRDRSNTLQLEVLSRKDKTETSNFVDFHFSSDFSRFWIDNGVKPSYTYVVENPDSIRELFMVLLTGKTENKVLETAIEADRIRKDTEYITVIYCKETDNNSGIIQVGTLHADYVAQYLCAMYWSETRAPSETPASPRSVEFILEDDLRIQIWKYPKLAVIRDGEEEFWFKTWHEDYTAAIELIQTYCLTQAQSAELLGNEPSEKPTATPSAAPTMSPTPEPTSTPEPDSSQIETEILMEATGETDPYAETTKESTSDSSQIETEILMEETKELSTDTPKSTPSPTAVPTPTPKPE